MKKIVSGEYLYDYDKIRFSKHTSNSLDPSSEVWSQPYCTNYFSLVYVVKGAVMVYAKDKNFVLNAGECTVFDIYDNTPMFTHNNNTAILYTIDFQPELFGKTSLEIKDFTGMLKYISNIPKNEHIRFPRYYIFKDKGNRLLTIFEIVKNEYFERKPLYLEIISNNIKTILIEFARDIHLLKKIDTYSNTVQQLIDYCILYYNTDITLKGLSETFHFSQTHITNLFKKTVGYSFLEYLRQLRIYKAQGMLFRTNNTVSEISKAVGYKKTEYFSKLFKQYTGLTPLQYRKKIRSLNQWYPGMQDIKIQHKNTTL
ncbi:MAG: AraC family transcriptional regulator [Clostridia bacterium]|nr:AraC family transcriptional regulator [Clostridia bacterium]